MGKITKKSVAGLLSAVMAFNIAAAAAVTNAAGTKYEFEDAVYTGDIVLDGDGLFMKESGTITVTVDVPETGSYNIIIYAFGSGGDKPQNISVNGVSQGVLSIPAGTDYVPCKMEAVPLKAGSNTIAIEKSWGWSKFDYLEVEAVTLPPVQATDTTCCDPDIIPEAQNLMNYMASVYGSHIISGQQEIYMYGPHDFDYEFDYIKDLTGEVPAIRGFDYLNEANILYGSNDGTTDRMIDWVKNKNGIITASWHITVPKDFDNYVLGETSVDWSSATYAVWDDNAKTIPATTFDTSQIMVEGTKEREYWMACLAKLAESIQKLEDQNIPLIFRPLHEAEGGGGESGSWFFWGQDGSEVYKELWRLTYDTLVNEYGLHNIIWEWNSYAYDTSANWYPGDDYVDIIAYDKYNCTDWSTGSPVLKHNDSAISSTFYSIMQKYDSKKMVAMAENDSIPTVQNLIDEKAGWLYFCPWYDGGSDSTNFLSNPIFNTKEDLTAMYQSDYCITLDELPADLYTNGEVTTRPTVTTKPTETTTTTTTAKPGPTNEIKAEITDADGNYIFSFEEAMGDTVYIVLDATDAVTFANGCVGVSVNVDGNDYWVSYQWQIAGDDTLKIDLTSPKEVSYNDGADKVEDEALLEKIVAAVQEQTGGQVQMWWTNDASGEKIENSNVVLVDAYLIKSSETTETTTETTTTETVTETTTTETTVTSNTSETTTETTIITPPDGVIGDINLDGGVSLVDVVMLNKALAGSIQLSDVQRIVAECVVDNEINANDTGAILAYIIGKVEVLPILPE